MSEAESKRVVVRYSTWGRICCILLALMIPVGLPICLSIFEDKPTVGHWIAFGIFGLGFLSFPIIAYRFEFRIDENEIFHREILTRCIPLVEVMEIRVARERRGGVVKRVAIEILGNNSRILVSYRESKLKDALSVLQERFPDQIVEVASLPDF